MGKTTANSNGYFVIKKVSKGEEGLVLHGAWIAESAETTVPDTQDSRPPIKVPKIPIPKYILPTKDNPFYQRVKDAAEAVGYETVEHEDFSYPGR